VNYNKSNSVFYMGFLEGGRGEGEAFSSPLVNKTWRWMDRCNIETSLMRTT
jgi:hypothetical protein